MSDSELFSINRMGLGRLVDPCLKTRVVQNYCSSINVLTLANRLTVL
jgi:hypothetical protein